MAERERGGRMNSSLPSPVRMESVDVLLFSTTERHLQLLREQNPRLMVSPSTSQQLAGAEGLFSLCLTKTIAAGLRAAGKRVGLVSELHQSPGLLIHTLTKVLQRCSPSSSRRQLTHNWGGWRCQSLHGVGGHGSCWAQASRRDEESQLTIRSWGRGGTGRLVSGKAAGCGIRAAVIQGQQLNGRGFQGGFLHSWKVRTGLLPCVGTDVSWCRSWTAQSREIFLQNKEEGGNLQRNPSAMAAEQLLTETSRAGARGSRPRFLLSHPKLGARCSPVPLNSSRLPPPKVPQRIDHQRSVCRVLQVPARSSRRRHSQTPPCRRNCTGTV